MSASDERGHDVMGLRSLGWDDGWRRQLDALGGGLEPARVAVEHRLDYELLGDTGRVRVPLASSLRPAATPRPSCPRSATGSRSARGLLAQLGPAGDWLAVARVSVLEQRGKAELEQHLAGGKTAALVGMSGVGKSSIANWLLSDETHATGAIRGSDDRGQHTTSHRSLFPLPAGGVLIDTPGMRELGLWTDPASLRGAFPDIDALARQCRFDDCQHAAEPGCAVRAALADGTLELARLAHYHALRDELLERSGPQRRKPTGPRRRA